MSPKLHCRRGFLGLAVVAFLLAGCGFQPLYGSRGSSGDSALRAVSIGLIPDREGQILRNYLIDLFQPSGESRYQLQSDISISERDLGTRSDSITVRSRVTVSVQFRLTGPDGLSETFTQRVAGSYSTTESDYASLVAREDAIRRALREIARDAKLRVASLIDGN